MSIDSENIQNKIDLLANFSECGLSTANRIIGGEFAAIGEFTWMALLIYSKPNGYGMHCAGTLINNRYVLTAAHCVKGYKLPKSWTLVAVRLGEYDIETNPDCVPASNNSTDCSDPIIDVEINDIIVHKEYNPFDINQRNDIALIRLLSYVNYTEYISPICLPTTNIFKEFRNELMISGWGKTNNSFKSHIKLKLQVLLVTKSICNEIYQRALVNITDSQICAGGELNKDTCHGDSGGPLMTPEINPITNVYNWFQIGIISFGSITCGAKDWPSIYTNITTFMPWILSNLRP